MAAEQDYQNGTRTFKFKPEATVKAIKLTSSMEIQTGFGLTRAYAGEFVLTLPSGQQFPISPASFDAIAYGAPDPETGR